jgi:hypothetical protein
MNMESTQGVSEPGSAEPNETREFKILLDIPSQHAALRFEEYGQGLAEIIEHSTPRFAIGIFGGWGSGKTTLMQAIKRRLNRESVVSVEFNAWRYEKEAHLILPLLDSVREALASWDTANEGARERARKTAAKVGRVALGLLMGFSFKFGLPHAVEVGVDPNAAMEAANKQLDDRLTQPVSVYYSAFAELKRTFDEFAASKEAPRIVVFIDDLDRCLPAGALEVMESMKLFFDLEGFVFVVGLDRRAIETSIDSRYRDIRGSSDRVRDELAYESADYMNKIFQVEFTLLPVALNSLNAFIKALIRDNDLPESQARDLHARVEPHLGYLFTSSGVNPRRLKQYVNAYTIQLKLNPSLDRDVLLALQTIDFRKDWATVRRGLYSQREWFISAVRQAEGDRAAFAEVYPEYAPLPEDFLQYVAVSAPGRRLLEVASLREYLQSGEAVRGAQVAESLEFGPAITQLLALVRKVDAKQSTRRNLPTVLAVRREVTSIRAKLAQYDLDSPAFEALEAKVTELLALAPPFEEAELQAWQEAIYPLIRGAWDRLTQQPAAVERMSEERGT